MFEAIHLPLITYDSAIGPVVLTSEYGNFTSIYFISAETPWVTDVDCAREAAHDLASTVQCSPNEQHFPDVDPLPDIFLNIDADGTETLIHIDDLDH